MNAPPQEYYDVVNELLAGLKDQEDRAPRAYCLGMSALIWERTGEVPSRAIMERLAACVTIDEGVAFAREVIEFGEANAG